MEINKKFRIEAIELAVTKELEQEYTQKGFHVSRDFKFEGQIVDLYAEKGDEKYIFEIKARPISPKELPILESIRKKAKEQNINFRVVIAPLQQHKTIKVDGIENLLLNHFINDMPDELDTLSPRTLIEEIDNVEFEKIEILSDGKIIIKGSSAFLVGLDFYDDDDETPTYMSFPFTFEGIFYISDGKLLLEEMTRLKIDTTSFIR